MASRTTRTILSGLLLLPFWLIAGVVLFFVEFSTWHGASDRWEPRVIEALWFLSLPIGWVFVVRRGIRKAAEEQRLATEERIGAQKLRRRDDS